MGKSVNDCFSYYGGGICVKGDSCHYRHEPRARGCRFICTRWLRRLCTNDRCPLRHALYDVHPLRAWEDRQVYAPLLKSHFLGQTPNFPVRGKEDRNTRRYRGKHPNRFCRSTSFSLGNRRGGLRSTRTSSFRAIEFSGDLVPEQAQSQCRLTDHRGYVIGNGDLRSSIDGENGNWEDSVSETQFIHDDALCQSNSNANGNDTVREDSFRSSENGREADVNHGSNKSGVPISKSRELDPMNFTVTFKINKNSQMELSEDNCNSHGLIINCRKERCSEHEKILDLKFLERGERGSTKISSHSGRNTDSFDVNSVIALRLSITLNDNALSRDPPISIPSRQNQEYTSPNFTPNDANEEWLRTNEGYVPNVEYSSNNRRAMSRSSVQSVGDANDLSPSTNLQPIPPIRLKRSRSAGSKETWKIRRPRSKTRKRSPKKAHSSRKDRRYHSPATEDAPANEALVFCECKLRETMNSNSESRTLNRNGIRVRASRSVSV